MTPAQEQARLEAALARIFQLCEANRAAMLKAREDQKLSRRRSAFDYLKPTHH